MGRICINFTEGLCIAILLVFPSCDKGENGQDCVPEICGDGIDNDCDGNTDEWDSDCSSSENCEDGIDNDGDGNADCWDSDCGFEGTIEITCNDGRDNDCDGNSDEWDDDCSSSSVGKMCAGECRVDSDCEGPYYCKRTKPSELPNESIVNYYSCSYSSTPPDPTEEIIDSCVGSSSCSASSGCSVTQACSIEAKGYGNCTPENQCSFCNPDEVCCGEICCWPGKLCYNNTCQDCNPDTNEGCEGDETCVLSFILRHLNKNVCGYCHGLCEEDIDCAPLGAICEEM